MTRFNDIHYLEYFPLRYSPDNIKELLFKATYDWHECQECACGGACHQIDCQWKQQRSLELYYQHYVYLTSWTAPKDCISPHLALRCHQDLLCIIRSIRKQPKVRRDVLIKQHFFTYGEAQPTEVEKGRAFDLAFEILTMIPCSEKNYYLDSEPVPVCFTWKNWQTAAKLVRSAIPKGSMLNAATSSRIMQGVSAERLERSGFELIETRELHRHLSFDPHSKLMHVFYDVAFLKACIKAGKSSLEQYQEIIPSDFIMETMFTVSIILFRRNDLGSRKIATRIGCDVACLELDASFSHGIGDNYIRLPHWGERLGELLDEIELAERNKIWRFRCKPYIIVGGVTAFLSVLALIVAIVGVVYESKQGPDLSPVLGSLRDKCCLYASGHGSDSNSTESSTTGLPWKG